mgnify:CR=1 FL=1
MDKIPKNTKLNLGCGKDYREGFFNVDQDKEVKAVAHFDLNKYPYPFKEGGMDFILALNVMEHLNEPQQFLEECYRILKPNGKIFLQVPLFGAWSGPHLNHKYAGFTPYSFKILEQERWKFEFTKCPFRVRKMQVSTPFNWKLRFPWQCSLINMFVNNIFSQLFVTLQKKDEKEKI